MKKKDKVIQEKIIVTDAPPPKTHFFQKHFMRLAMGLGIVLLVYVGLQQYEKMQYRRCKNAYKNAHSQAQKRTFASDFMGQPLAAKVSLELADTFYTEGNYKDALKFYELAGQGLVTTPLGPRAYLGKAMSLVQLKQPEQAEKLFKRLMNDPKALGGLQAEAALQAMLLALQNKDEAAIVQYRQELEALPYSELALERVRLIEDLAKAEPAADKK